MKRSIHGLGKMHENGEILADLCAFKKLIVEDSVFTHRRIHKATWIPPDHRTENQTISVYDKSSGDQCRT